MWVKLFPEFHEAQLLMSGLHMNPPVELFMKTSNIILFNLNPICIVDSSHVVEIRVDWRLIENAEEKTLITE